MTTNYFVRTVTDQLTSRVLRNVVWLGRDWKDGRRGGRAVPAGVEADKVRLQPESIRRSLLPGLDWSRVEVGNRNLTTETNQLLS